MSQTVFGASAGSLPTDNGLDTVRLKNPGGQIKIARQISSSVGTPILGDRFIEIDERKNKKFWNLGRVFMMLWSEPARSKSIHTASSPSESNYPSIWLGTLVFSDIRRFVVIGQGYGNVICSPIHTYAGEATLKANYPIDNSMQSYTPVHNLQMNFLYATKVVTYYKKTWRNLLFELSVKCQAQMGI